MNEDPTLPLTPGQSQAPAPPPRMAWGGFSLLARVGFGGFGEVYRAWDPNLQREVALKLLLPGVVGGEAQYELMLREARALAAVQHANIVHIYGIDRHDGRVGFWTDFVKGKTLSALLAEQGPFGPREAAAIALDVTRALAAVHRTGILHRDIKAENVMREEGGRILLMDFGLSSLPQGQLQLAGTPSYMAPELFRGAPASVCSDIYAMGILLFHLVSRDYPVHLPGFTPPEVDRAFRQRAPLVDLRPDLPESFLRTVARATDQDPAKRFASAGQFAESLAESLTLPFQPEPAAEPIKPKKERSWRGYLITVTVLAFVFGGRIVRSIRDVFRPNPAVVQSGAAPEDSAGHLRRGEELLAKSYQNANTAKAIQQFLAIPPTDDHYALAQAGLGAAYFIQYRAAHTPALLDGSQAATDRAMKVDPALSPPYVTLARIAALSGDTAQATQYAQKALALDPRSADAHRALAEVYDAEGRHGEAIAEMQKAEDLAPDDWRWPLNLGNYYFAAGDLDKAAEKYERSAELAPDNATAFYDLGMVRMRKSDPDEAKVDFRRSLKIEDAPNGEQMLGEVLMAQGNYADAVAAEEKASRLAPDDYSIWGDLGKAYFMRNDHAHGDAAYRRAIAAAETALKREPKNAPLLVLLAHYHVMVGDAARSTVLLRQALALSGDDPGVNYGAGATYELLHQRDQAMQLIAKALAHGYRAGEFEGDPTLAALRGDPRWPGVLHQANAAIHLDTPSKMN